VYLLDTCTFLWMLGESSNLSPKAVEALTAKQTKLLLSIASAWELAIKDGRHGLKLKVPVKDLISDIGVKQYKLELLPISLDDCEQVSKLPFYHRDPFDRMLIAQAISGGLTILSPDPVIHSYPVKTMW
jgi:PIN domain nuclease of toxin-antitoxin system